MPGRGIRARINEKRPNKKAVFITHFPVAFFTAILYNAGQLEKRDRDIYRESKSTRSCSRSRPRLVPVLDAENERRLRAENKLLRDKVDPARPARLSAAPARSSTRTSCCSIWARAKSPASTRSRPPGRRRRPPHGRSAPRSATACPTGCPRSASSSTRPRSRPVRKSGA
jgi:hypothetical protein